MYSPTHYSEVSPPPSLSRPRPWSPDPTDPVPPLHSLTGQFVRTSQAIDNDWTSATHPHPRHDASDPSIDALDLGDYARALNSHAYPTYPAYDDSLISPPPRSISVTTRASLKPPSLVSSRGTPTSRSHNTSSLRHTNYRAFPPSIPESLAQPSVYIPSENGLYSTDILHPPLDTASSRGGVPNSEIDISQFPAWSRGWYAKERKSLKTEPQSEASHPPFFDPSYRAHGLAGNYYDPYAATNSSSSRDYVPWSNNDNPNYDVPLDPELKEERIRMLEHEFRSGTEEAVEEPVGSVDQNGRLITDGPKKRVAIRVVEALLALGIAFSVIYAALWIKTSSPPPPQSQPHTFALYALSIVTCLFFLYRFLIRPCCFGGRQKKRNPTGFGPGGLAVLPVQGLPGDNKKKKKGKKGKGEQGSVQVNLIVDPTMFRSALGPDDEERADLDERSGSLSQTGTSRRTKRRSVFEGLALEEEWRAARKELKWLLFTDTIFFFLWSVEFVWTLIREKCHPGGFNGWCNAYNVASAGACFLGLVFGLNVFFDVKDLHQSRVSPRTRT